MGKRRGRGQEDWRETMIEESHRVEVPTASVCQASTPKTERGKCVLGENPKGQVAQTQARRGEVEVTSLQEVVQGGGGRKIGRERRERKQ